MSRGGSKERKEFKNEHFIDVTVSIEDYDRDTVLKLVEITLRITKEQEENYKRKASEELIELHNKTWNEGEINSKEEFVNRIKLEGILFFCEGNAELYYNDGDLFWGHTIVVDVNENGEYESAQING
ncbi:DUF2262 domain-containing protein [Bacillus sp. FJAT-50079]|uniref:DUF2262 domain-containing protein n=1 Tax=Bacillus sp. FJAT-50079 TaxID=2833577 RepID=UPI001BCA2E95|nr:DUF2262 domain-containing protein [Bacillus sp. FJAT-50079]MBS4207224.1 DUF2262 domain-containing protein [Bacillus sp. FJAT-50079]